MNSFKTKEIHMDLVVARSSISLSLHGVKVVLWPSAAAVPSIAVALLYIDNSALIARLDADDDDLRSKERGSEIQVGNHVSLGKF